MQRTKIAASILAAAATVATVLVSAKADLARLTDGPPLITVNSKSGGAITISPGDFQGVRVNGNPAGVQISRFNVNRESLGRVNLPRQAGRNGFAGPRSLMLPGHTFNLPSISDGNHGIALENSGADMNVQVPGHVQALLINAGASPVTLDRIAGPFVIVSDTGDVTLRNVTGRGIIRTNSGNVDVRGTTGYVHIETVSGHVTLQLAGSLDRAEVIDLQGDVDWLFNGVGGGAYRINAGEGVVRVLVRPGLGVTVDAQADSGAVANYLDPNVADVRFSRPHYVELAVGGGGAQIVAHSRNGTVIVAPAP